MRLASYHSDRGIRAAVVVDGNYVDLADLGEGLPTSVLAFFAGGPALRKTLDARLARGGVTPLGEVTLAPPIPRPGKVICIGLNYADHAREIGIHAGSSPVVFAKLSSSISGPNQDIVLSHESEQVDYEAELVAVIGTEARRVKADEALSYIGGLTCGNDITARDWQFGAPGNQWTLGKSFDAFASTGPEIVTADELPLDRPLAISLTLNGEVKQQSSTDQLIFGLREIIAHVTRVVTLEPGDLIFTGTPAGIGYSRRPQVFLAPGDVTDVTIEGIGTLTNRFVADPETPAERLATAGTAQD